MPAYVITYLEVTDRERFDEYRRLAGPTFARYGGRPIVVDGRFEVLESMINPKSIVIVQFENFEDAKRCTRRNTRRPFHSPEPVGELEPHPR